MATAEEITRAGVSPELLPRALHGALVALVRNATRAAADAIAGGDERVQRQLLREFIDFGKRLRSRA